MGSGGAGRGPSGASGVGGGGALGGFGGVASQGSTWHGEALGGVTFTSQAVTPLTDKTSRYFFSWGPHRKHGDEALRDALMQLADMAFGEDKVMIEAQQKVIDRTPDPRVMPIAHDKGVTMFNRLVERLSRAETEGSRDAA